MVVLWGICFQKTEQWQFSWKLNTHSLKNQCSSKPLNCLYLLWGESVGISQRSVTWAWHHLPSTLHVCRQPTVFQSSCKRHCCELFGGWRCNTRCELCITASIIKKVSLFLTLLLPYETQSLWPINYWYNCNIKSPSCIFFCNVSLLNCNSCCWFIYLCICFQSVFGCFPFHITGGGRVFFSIFHLSHLVEFNALIFSLWYGVRHFWKNCQVQISYGWGGCNIGTTEHKPRLEHWIWHSIFLLTSSSFAFVSSGGFSL